MRLALALLGALLVTSPLFAADFPDPLSMTDGTKVATKEDWNDKRKPELKALFQKHMYGRYPEVRSKISAKVLYEDRKLSVDSAPCAKSNSPSVSKIARRCTC